MKILQKIEIILGLVLLAVLVFGVSNSRQAAPKKGTVKDKIFSVLATFDFADPESFYSVSQIKELGEETLPVLYELIESQSLSDRWAAIVLLPEFARETPGLKEEVILNLKKALKDQDDTLRMLNGVQLASLGEKQGIESLISCLSSEETTHFGEPPELVGERALAYLQYYTVFDGENDKEWQEWWQDNNEKLIWNREEEIYEISQ